MSFSFSWKETAAWVGSGTAVITGAWAFWRFIGKTLWSMYMFAKSVERFSEIAGAFVENFTPDKVEKLASLANDIPADLSKKLDEIGAQLRPNGGSSLADRVNEIKIMISQEHDATRSIISLTGSAFWESNAKGECIFASRPLADMMGVSQQDVLGNGWLSAVHSEDVSRLTEEWELAIEQKRRFSSIYRFVLKNSDVNKVRGTAVPMTDPSGVVFRWIGVFELIERIPGKYNGQ